MTIKGGIRPAEQFFLYLKHIRKESNKDPRR